MKWHKVITRLIMNKGRCRKGITLTEIMVSVAILALVAAPFLASFLSATKNNTLSKIKMEASVMAQKVMEEIKAKPVFLSTEAASDNGQMKEYDVAPADNRFKIWYRINTEQTGSLPQGSQPYDFVTNTTYNLEYLVKQNQVSLNGDNNHLYDLASKKYKLNISGTNGAYSYSFNDENDAVQNPQNLPNVSSGSPIAVKIKFDNATSIFELHVNLDSNIDKDVNFYIFDNTGNLKLVNDGSKIFYQYDNMSSSTVKEYKNTLYKIKVNVEKDSEVVSTLVSYVKK